MRYGFQTVKVFNAVYVYELSCSLKGLLLQFGLVLVKNVKFEKKINC